MEVQVSIMPALQVNVTDPIFIGGFWGFILSLPILLLVSYWISSAGIKRAARGAVGAVAGAFLGFLIILGWVDTRIFPSPLPGANSTSTFFGSLLLCSVLGVMGCIFTDQAIIHRKGSHTRI